jgi:hypothetical protein
MGEAATCSRNDRHTDILCKEGFSTKHFIISLTAVPRYRLIVLVQYVSYIVSEKEIATYKAALFYSFPLLVVLT